MKIRSTQSGFSPVEVLIVVAVVAVLGLVGYTVYNRQQDKTASTSNTQQVVSQAPTAEDVKAAPAVSSTSDLDKAAQVLDQTDPGGSNNSDASQLDNQVSNF